jgi:hypothetical protein
MLNPVEKTSWMFSVPPGDRSDLRVILWWEQRRIPYNLIVGLVGLCSFAFFSLAVLQSGDLKPGEDAIEPLALLAAPIVINIAYTAGWITEIAARNLRPGKATPIGPALLRIGLLLSIGLALIPSVVWGIRWAAHAMGLTQ